MCDLDLFSAKQLAQIEDITKKTFDESFTSNVGLKLIDFKTDIINNFDNKLTENRMILSDTLNQAVDKFKCEADSLKDSMIDISKSAVHEIVNGEFDKLNDLICNKTIYGAFINGMKDRPIRTFIAIMATLGFFILAILNSFHITNVTGKNIIDVIKLVIPFV
jgi:hypothetical protein